MSYSLTILGCGPSGGVPRIGVNWGKCDPGNPKNRRLRCSVLVQRFSKNGVTRVLVDTSPDLREQLLRARVSDLDGVLFTHDHADHTHGIDDLRPVFFANKRRIDAYGDSATLASLSSRFAYCFKTERDSGYSPILRACEVSPGRRVLIKGRGGDIVVTPIAQKHGGMASLGFRIGSLAYCPDVSDFPDASLDLLEGLGVLVVDALRYTPHPSHFHLKKALSWISRLSPKRAVLTHMTTELDYDTLVRELPEGVEPAFDGMVIEFDG